MGTLNRDEQALVVMLLVADGMAAGRAFVEGQLSQIIMSHVSVLIVARVISDVVLLGLKDFE
jgi:hypothetical protein